MTEVDPSATQADIFAGVVGELAAAGFDHAHEVGRGGFGVVYRCEQPGLGRTVAVKVLSALLDRENHERFLREEYVMGRLSGHPNITTVLQVGSITGGRPFIVMPYFSRDSLDARIRREGPCGWSWALRIGIKVAGALETAHRSGILHRDVKPANILLTDYLEPQLTDFGIARIAGGFETGTGNIAGSLAFTAPEVLSGASPTIASDVYSLGASLFNLIAGHAPFERRADEESVAQFLRITIEDIPDLRATGAPDDVCEVIERAMARDPAFRPQSAAALGDELRTVQSNHDLAIDEMALPAAVDAPGVDGEVPVLQQVQSGGRRHRVEAGTRLPAPLTSFVGRQREVGDVGNLLDKARLVTLTGPGGVGKTRLALQIAVRLEHGIPGRVWLIELGHVLEPGHLFDTVVDALQLGDEHMRAIQPTHALAVRLAEFLGARSAMIILDNCEHLLAECRPLIGELLRTVRGLQILVTSRQVLGIAGEHIYTVPPLSLPDPAEIDSAPAPLERLLHHEAAELFVERARAVLPGFTMTDSDCVGVAKLCAQLDGIPLAIELAAARLRTFGVDELLQIVEDRYRLLTTGSSATEPRHRTLRALVDWSYQLLTPDEREIWTAASLFTGEFTAAGAIEVCGGPTHTTPDVRYILASLVDKSMLSSMSRNGVHRYRLLVTLREYAEQRLAESADRQLYVDRYVDRYSRIASEFRRDWFSARQVAAFTAVHDERENLRAALTYSQVDGRMSAVGAGIVTSLHFYWLASTTLTEARRLLAAAIDCSPADPTVEAHALWSSAMIAMVQNDIAGAENYARRAREIAEGVGDLSSVGYAGLAIGVVALCHNNVHGGLAEYEAALSFQRAAGNPVGIVSTISGLLTALAESGNEAHAAELWQEAVEMCTAAEDKWHLAYLMFAHGYLAFSNGDIDRALQDERTSLRLSRPFADRVIVAWALEALSWIAAQRNEFEHSARLRGAAAASWASGDASVQGYGTMSDHQRLADALVRAELGDERTDELIGIGARTPGDVMVAEVLATDPPSNRLPLGGNG